MAMSDHPYFTPSSSTHAAHVPTDGLPAELPDLSSSVAPPTPKGLYPEHLATTFSAIPPSFNQPQHCDSTLLTPISGAGSPPTQHKHQLVQHHHPTTISAAAAAAATAPRRSPNSVDYQQQQPTPPSSSRMYHHQWNSGFDMGTAATPSQSGSPMTMPPVTAEQQFDEMNYIMDGSGGPQRDDIPPPPSPYYGSFLASEQKTEHGEPVTEPSHTVHQAGYYVDSMHHPQTHPHHPQIAHLATQTLAPSALAMKQEEGPIHMDALHHHQAQQQNPHHPFSRHVMSPVPTTSETSSEDHILNPGTPAHFRNSLNLSRNLGGQEDVHMLHTFPLSASSGAMDSPAMQHVQQRKSAQTSRVFRRTRMHRRQPTPPADGDNKKCEGKARRSTATVNAEKTTPGDGSKQVVFSTDDPASQGLLQFKDDMPETDRFLFELRNKHSDSKGKGMWEPITEEFNKRFKTNLERSALQMRVFRAKSRWVKWNATEDLILVEAARQTEQQYYRNVHAKFRELGGNRSQADFAVGNIEARMVELGMAEAFVEPWKGDTKMPTRRRRKLNERQRNNSLRGHDDPATSGRNPSFAVNNQQGPLHHDAHMGGIIHSTTGSVSAAGFPEVGLTPDVRERVLDEIEARAYPLEPESPESEVQEDGMDSSATGGSAPKTGNTGGNGYGKAPQQQQQNHHHRQQQQKHQHKQQQANPKVARQTSKIAKQACQDILRGDGGTPPAPPTKGGKKGSAQSRP